MRKPQMLWVMGLLVAFPLCSQFHAQTVHPAKPAGESLFSRVNRLAPLSKSGNSTATVELTHQLFTNIGVSPVIADAFGYTDRIVHAETEYRHGAHSAVHESDIVKAVNNMADAIGVPQWVHTSQPEVRKLRMHMLVLYPRLIASQEPPDAKGHYKAVSDDISPVEASYIAATMIYQKIYNSDYQFMDAEKATNAKLGASAVFNKHLERERMLQDILSGKTQTISVRDLLTVSGQFFNDLGIQPTTYTDALVNRLSMNQKGGQ